MKVDIDFDQLKSFVRPLCVGTASDDRKHTCAYTCKTHETHYMDTPFIHSVAARTRYVDTYTRLQRTSGCAAYRYLVRCTVLFRLLMFIHTRICVALYKYFPK